MMNMFTTSIAVTSLFLLLGVTVQAWNGQDEPASMSDSWGINFKLTDQANFDSEVDWTSDVQGFEPSLNYDDNYGFEFTYRVTNFVLANQGSMAIYTKECRSDGGKLIDTMGDGITAPGPDGNTTGLNDGFKMNEMFGDGTGLTGERDASLIKPTSTYTMKVGLDPQNFPTNTDIFTKTNETVSQIEFCLIFSLHTLDENGDRTTEVNFQETGVTLNVNLQDTNSTFTLEDVSLAAKGKTSTSDDVSYTPTAFVCDNAGAALTKSFNQGEVIDICIKPDGPSQAQGGDGLVMNEITLLEYTLNEDDSVKQTALPAGLNMGLSEHTTSDCLDKPYCTVSTVLLASFFATTGTVKVGGQASLKFLGGVRRLNDGRGDRGRRSLQDSGVQASAPFDMTFDVTTSDDGPSMATLMAGGNNGSTISIIVMMGSVIFTTIATTMLI